MKKLMLLGLLCGLATGAALAQELRIQKQTIGAPSGEIMLPTFDLISTGGTVDAKQIKGAPIAAEFSFESVQVLPDGNRIVRRSSTNFHRDNDGRTRREQSFGGLGILPSGGQELARQVFLYDPVMSINYVLNPLFRTAHRAKIFTVNVDVNAKPDKVNPRIKVISSSENLLIDPAVKSRIDKLVEETSKNAANRPHSETREESLGTSNIEGTEADGKRVTTILPVGFMGNEKPIEIVRETWYSKELQMVVLSQTKNPLSGEQTYKLTRLTRGEQPRRLFEVPSDYKIVDGSKLFNHLLPVPSGGVEPTLLHFPDSSNDETRLLLLKEALKAERSSK